MPLFETISDLKAGAERIRRRRYGLIVVDQERLQSVQLRPWPKIVVGGEGLFGGGLRQRGEGNRIWLYYNQPRRHSRFLALKYIVSSRCATFRTLRSALIILDEVARLKQVDAIVCEVRNLRISDRFLARWGWESHVPSSRRRHFIKRFYGSYPDPHAAWALMGVSQSTPRP